MTLRDTTNLNREMLDYLPKYYEDFTVATNIIDRESAEFQAMNNEIKSVLDQFFVDTATYALSRWERLVGIVPDESKPLDQRRSLIKSKLRGIGTVTVGLIKNVAESYANGEVEVTEQPTSYTITVKFVGSLGVPPNLTDIQNAIKDVIPAHLKIKFEFTYVLYSELNTKYASYDALRTAGKTYAVIVTDR